MPTVTLNDENGNGVQPGEKTIAIEIDLRTEEIGRSTPRFSLSRFFSDGQGGLERMSQFEPADLPRLVCVVQILCGHFAKLDELDEFTARHLQCLHNILAEFMEYSLERMEAGDREYFLRLQAHSTPQ